MTSRIWLRALCAAAIILSGAHPALAADPSPSPTPAEIGHVTTTDRSNETLANVTRTVHVITKHDIIEHGYRSIADALSALPGVNLSVYGATGSAASVSIRGSSSAQVLVLIDGIPGGGAQTGTLDLNSISTAGIDRIEVVEGGGSTLYGAGSIGGIVNIITHPLAGSAIVDVRSGSSGDRMVRVETRNLSFERAVAANNYPYPGGTRADADSEMTTARFSFARSAGKLDFDVSGGLNAHNVGAPGSIPATFTTPARQRSVDRDLHVGVTANRGHATTVLELGGASQQLFYTCNAPMDPNCFSPLGALTLDSRVQLSLRNTVTQAASKTVYGMDLARGSARIDDGGGNSLFAFPPVPLAAAISTNAYSQTAVFAQQSWILQSGSRFYAGVRAERDGAQGGIIAPAVGFLTHAGPKITLRGNFATAFRAPTAVELYYPGYGDPSLQPERVRVADLTLTNAGILGGVSVGWFGSWAHNLIVSDPATFMAHNVGVASIAGITAEVKTRPFHHIYERLGVTDIYRAVDLTPGSSNLNGRIFGSGPVFQVTNELGFAGDPQAFVHSAGVTVHAHGAQVAFGTAPAFTQIDAFARFRLNTSMLFTIRTYNLGNEAVQLQPGYPLPGRALVFELSTR